MVIRYIHYNINILAGGYHREVDAARAYDLAALKIHGLYTSLNFPVCDKFVRTLYKMVVINPFY